MKKGDMVKMKQESVDEGHGLDWLAPGLIINGPYGSVQHYTIAKQKVIDETMVVDVLVGSKIYDKVPILMLEKIRS